MLLRKWLRAIPPGCSAHNGWGGSFARWAHPPNCALMDQLKLLKRDPQAAPNRGEVRGQHERAPHGNAGALEKSLTTGNESAQCERQQQAQAGTRRVPLGGTPWLGSRAGRGPWHVGEWYCGARGGRAGDQLVAVGEGVRSPCGQKVSWVGGDRAGVRSVRATGLARNMYCAVGRIALGGGGRAGWAAGLVGGCACATRGGCLPSADGRAREMLRQRAGGSSGARQCVNVPDVDIFDMYPNYVAHVSVHLWTIREVQHGGTLARPPTNQIYTNRAEILPCHPPAHRKRCM